MIARKDAEIGALESRLAKLGMRRSTPDDPAPMSGGSLKVLRRTVRVDSPSPMPPTGHRGKAPPIDAFDGESLEVKFDDWYPMLQRAATWNGWSEQETLTS